MGFVFRRGRSTRLWNGLASSGPPLPVMSVGAPTAAPPLGHAEGQR